MIGWRKLGGIALAGLAFGLEWLEWAYHHLQDEPQPKRLSTTPTRTYDAPTATLNGEPLPRPPRVPVIVSGPCSCGATYRVAPCPVHPHTSALHTDVRHDGGKSGGGNPYG